MTKSGDEPVYIIDRVRHLTGSAYVLRFSRNGMRFYPGQHLVIGLPGATGMREYSIYNGLHGDFLEVLIREVDEGTLSRELKNMKHGDRLEVRGPFGFFLSKAPDAGSGKRLFIASGTGIAPFHSFVRSYPGLDYRLIHGVRTLEEVYDREHYREEWMVVCTSRDRSGDFHGRLTDYLSQTVPDPDLQVYLCGSGNMINDALDILHTGGFSHRHLFTEIYF